MIANFLIAMIIAKMAVLMMYLAFTQHPWHASFVAVLITLMLAWLMWRVERKAND